MPSPPSARIRPFPWRDLPRVARRDASLIRWLHRSLGSSAGAWCDWSRQCLGLEPAETRWSAPVVLSQQQAEQLWPQLRAGVCLRLTGADGADEALVLELSLAEQLLSAFLRAPDVVSSGMLGVGQQGLLVFLLSSLFGALPGPRRLVRGCDPLPASPTAGDVAFQGRLRLGDRHHLVWLLRDASILDQPAPALDAVLHHSRAGRVLGARVSLPLIAARARLEALALTGAAAGDTIVIPHPLPAGEQAPRQAELGLGDGGFAVQVAGQSLEILEPYNRRQQTMSIKHPDPERTSTLAEQLDVEVVFELGRAELLASEVLVLSVGDVVSLPKPVGSAVDVRVGGRLFGRGELVDVDGETGVRLLEVFD